MHHRTTAIGVLVLAAALTVGEPMAGSSGARAADASADIPGVPLTGSIAAGRLGGAIYDVVYSLSVAPGYVIVASLTGTAGTDFDLYLFDSTATTVLSDSGLRAKSTGPTSSESISWPSRFGGTYYLDLNGSTDVEGDFRLAVQTVPDPTPPTTSIVLAGGAPSTNQLMVPVTLSASDDLSGVAEMAFSSDGVTYGAWTPYQRSTSWTFAQGDGVQRLWVKVKNGVGLESQPASASVRIDQTPPSVVGFTPKPGSAVVGPRPTFTVSFSEPIDQATWRDLGLIVQSSTGALVSGTYGYESATRTGTFVPTVDMHAGQTYVVTVGDVKDVSGNRVTSPGSWSITPLAATSIVTTASTKVIEQGKSAQINVVMTGIPIGAAVDMLASNSAVGFVPLTTLPNDDGVATIVVTPDRNTTYRFTYAGAAGIAPSQADTRLLVRRSVVLAGRVPSATTKLTLGRSVSITADIRPAASGVGVSFRLYRFDPSRRAWVYAGSHGRSSDAFGRATLTWRPAGPGAYYWRVWVASTPDYANNVSPIYRWSVSR